jgi:hypothetical protein
MSVTFKDPVRTAQQTHSVSVIKTSQLMLCREIIAVCSEIHTKHTNTLCGQKAEIVNVKPDYLKQPLGFNPLQSSGHFTYQQV